MGNQLLIEEQNTPLHQVTGSTATKLELEIKRWAYSHWFVGVDFFQDEAATIPVVPASGQLTYTVETVASSEIMGIVDGTVTDLSNPACSRVRNFAGNPQKITVTFSGVSGAPFARFRAVGNMN